MSGTLEPTCSSCAASKPSILDFNVEIRWDWVTFTATEAKRSTAAIQNVGSSGLLINCVSLGIFRTQCLWPVRVKPCLAVCVLFHNSRRP